MTDQKRADFEMTLRELRARQTVTETVQTQLVFRIAELFDSPGEFVRLLMMGVEGNLRSAAKTAEGEERTMVTDAIEVFEQQSLAMIEALTVKNRPQ